MYTKNDIFIVTGASSGIGEATVLLLNKLGASVVAIARNIDKLNKVKSKCLYPENCLLEIKDLAENIEDLPDYINKLCGKYGKFSGMAYCAGILKLTPLSMISYKDAINIFNINYFAPIIMTKGLLNKKNNIGEGTSLVFLSSIDAFLSLKGQGLYGGSKSALSTTIKSISKEVISRGIRLNCLQPSMIKTPMTDNENFVAIGISEDNQRTNYPKGWGTPKDVSNFIEFLLSEKASFISGQNYIIDTGCAF